MNAGQPQPLIWLYVCKNSHCNIIFCTYNSYFEFWLPDRAHSPVKNLTPRELKQLVISSCFRSMYSTNTTLPFSQSFKITKYDVLYSTSKQIKSPLGIANKSFIFIYLIRFPNNFKLVFHKYYFIYSFIKYASILFIGYTFLVYTVWLNE